MTDLPEPINSARKRQSEPKANLLLVDDNPANLLSLRVILEDLGHNIMDAHSGEEALQTMRSVDFAVILLDVLMPGIGGFETARRVRTHDRTRHVPIIFLTSGDIDRSQLEEGYALGAVDFLVKPVLPFVLQAKVRGFVELFEDKQQAKRESEQLRQLINGTSDYAIFMLDPRGYIVTWNAGAERLKGYKADEIIGQHFSHFYPSDAIGSGWPSHELEVAQTEGRFEDEGWRLRKDGSRFWANVVLTALHDKAGDLLGFSKITRDLTERKQSEDSSRRLLQETTARRVAEENARLIQEHRERLQVTLASIGDAVISTDAEGQIEFLNSVAEELVGWKTEDAAGRHLEDVFRIVNEDTRRPVENPAIRALKEGVIIGLANHTILIAKDGTERPIDDSAAPIRNSQGNVIGSVLVFRDISERKAAEKDLHQSERELSDFFDNATVGLHWVGSDGIIQRANKAELKMLGYSREEYIGQPITNFHADEDVICDILERLKAGEQICEYPARLRCKDGSIKDVIIDSSVMFKDGGFVHTRCFTRDVTERKQSEAALRDSQRQLAEELEATIRLHALSTRLLTAVDLHEALDDVLREAVLASRADMGNVQLYNDQSHALEIVVQTGFREDFLEYFRTVHFDEGSACAQAMGSGERIVIEDVELDPSYEPHRPIAAAAGYRGVQSTPLKNSKGNVIGMLSTHFSQPHRPSEHAERLLDLYARHAADLIERHGFEDALRQSEGQFRQLADAMPQIVWTARPDGAIDYMNRKWHEFTGLSEALGNEGWQQITHPDEAQTASEKWASSVISGDRFEMEMRLLDRKEKVYRWHLIRTVAVQDASGRVARWFGTSTDIHEQKRAEESARYLAEASAALASVVDYRSTLEKIVNLAVPYFADWSAVDVSNEDGTLQRLAVAHQDADKVRFAHELMQQYPPDLQSPGGAVAVLRTGKPEIVSEITDDMLVRGARDERHLDLIRSLGLKSYICVPLVVSGKSLGVLTFATSESGRIYTDADLVLAKDLSQRAAIAIENTRLYGELKEADRRKDEFLATLAHELRNPLAPIRNSLQILKMPRVDAETVERSREMMERQVHHLVRLVDDLLDVSRVMRGKIELRRERIELATVIARAVETIQPILEVQGHELSVRLSTDSLPIDADPVRIVQVIGNLLTNAAKYTESNGHIWLTSEREGGMAVLKIRDSGIGIAEAMLTRIFELFVQVDNASTKTQGGLGIGLTLVKNLVEMHYGTVEAQSKGLGQGSEFVVRLPISENGLESVHDSERENDAHQRSSPSGHRLLVVDDNQDAANSLGMLLRLQGHEVQVAYSGVAALEMSKSYSPDMVFLDIGMPGMDGYEVARRLRQQPGMEGVVLAALTGWGQQEDRRRTAEAGFDHHLVKPPEPKVVERLLAALQ